MLGIAIATISTVVLLAVTGAAAYITWNEFTREHDAMMGCFALLGTLLMAALSSGPYLLWVVATAPTIELVKSDWTCTSSHREVRTNTVMVGKVMVPQTHVVTVCDQYTMIR